MGPSPAPTGTPTSVIIEGRGILGSLWSDVTGLFDDDDSTTSEETTQAATTTSQDATTTQAQTTSTT